ncbi:MAG: hypothetical protein ACD_73C00714G0003 [uncultured bacterium]|nr:MAG: hypothetical protein ACD_73C00714G0003 [uncultured bacterium]
MTPSCKKISVFDYIQYRRFLKDWFDHAKAFRGFSLRKFSEKAGFTSPNFLKMVMDGDRNLTEASLKKFVQALELNQQEQFFFINLVFFNQAKTHQKKDFFYKKLFQSPKFSQIKPIQKNQYEYYSAWYHPVVRELLISAARDVPLEQLARRLNPPITSKQIIKSVELLQKMGFIKKNQNGQWEQSTACVTTGDEPSEVTMINYHRNVLDIAKELISTTAQEKRDISALTLGISIKKFPEIKRKIQEFRKEILKMVSEDTEPDQVVLLTLQLLPVTQDHEVPQG